MEYHHPIMSMIWGHWGSSRIIRRITPWVFACAGFSDMSDRGSLLRDMLHSWGSFFVSGDFGGGYKVVGEFLLSFLRNLARLSYPISTGFSTLVAGSSTIWLLAWRCFCGILIFPQFPVITGAPKFLSSNSLRLQATSQEFFSLISFFIVSLQRNDLWDIFPYLQQASLLPPYFLMLCE